MKRKIVWYDKEYNSLTLEEIDDRYLLNILRHVSKGGGYSNLITDEMLKDLYMESLHRGLKHPYSLYEMKSSMKEKRMFDLWMSIEAEHDVF